MRNAAGALLIGLLACASAPGLAEARRPAQPAPACDRACLDGFADRYLDAMVARAPAGLPWAAGVRYSENSVPMMIGDGAWATLTAHTKAPLRAADPRTGQVVWMGEIEDHGQPGFLALRLKIDHGRIAEAEAVLRRKGGPPQYGDPLTYAPDPSFASGTGKGRISPQRLATEVSAYFDGLEGKAGAHPSFDPHCARQDNGVATTSGDTAEGGVQGCAAQFKAGVFKPIARVRARRLPIVDESRGVVVAAGFLDLPARSPKPAAGKGLAWAADYPYSIGFITAFKLRDGRIWRIDSISDAQPYLMPSPW